LTSKLKVKPDTDEITVPALDKAINDDVERLFQENDIEGLRELRKKFGKSAPVSIDRYVDELTAKQTEKPNKPSGLNLHVPIAWDEAVDGADVLTDVAECVQKHMAMAEHDTYTVALWAAHAHTVEAFDHSPRLAISAPAPQCGKTVLLSHLVGNLVPRPLSSELLTPASFFRVINQYRPTILIDEVDSWLREDSNLPAAINAGFEPGGGILRCQGDNHDVQMFKTFCPTALAGIRLRKKLPPATLDRSIVVELQRALPDEVAVPFNKRKHKDAVECLGRKLARWAQDNVSALKVLDPVLPPGVMNRQADKWLPLFAIAEIVGGLWPEWAKRALLSESVTTNESKEIQLLHDISHFLDAKPGYYDDVIFTNELIKELCALEDSYWKDYNFSARSDEGRCIQPRQLARLLGDFGVTSASHRRDRINRKGYRLSELVKVIDRYLNRHNVTSE